MNIKIIRMNKTDKYDTLKAFVDLQIDSVCIKGFKVIKGKEGLFLSNPSEKGKDNKYHDLVYFDSLSAKKEVEKAVLDEYSKQPVYNQQDVSF